MHKQNVRAIDGVVGLAMIRPGIISAEIGRRDIEDARDALDDADDPAEIVQSEISLDEMLSDFLAAAPSAEQARHWEDRLGGGAQRLAAYRERVELNEGRRRGETRAAV